ncbi:MAG: DUF6443 domain-containing protein [Flavobacterium sp.]
MKKYSLIITALLYSVFTLGQIETTSPQITRSFPTTASMMNFVDVPVNTFTGVPDISIPLYNFPTHSKDVNIDLSLNYHPAGISFLNKASDLGAGWNLNADGAISRTVVNEPDDYYGASHSFKNTFDDTYTYNFLGYTGTFQILRDKSNDTFTVLKTDSNLMQIEFDMNPSTFKINSFTFYDDKGYKYVFDQKEGAYGRFWAKRIWPDVPNQPIIAYTNAHHLTKVYDNNGNEIITYGYATYTAPFESGSPNTNSELKLNSIQANGFGKAEINYTYSSSLDYSSSDPAQMTDIVIKDSFGAVIKKFAFVSTYSTYFEKQRRFLYSVTELDKTLAEVKKYTLSYKQTYDTPFNCTDDYEYGTDKYGYLTLQPKYYIREGIAYFQGPIDRTLANVAPVGVLTSMALPTGGVINYDFESNTIAADTAVDHSLDSAPEDGADPDDFTATVYASTSFSTSTNTSWQFTVTGTTPKKLFFKGIATPYTSPLSDPPTKPLYPSYVISGNGITPFDFSDNVNDDKRYPCVGKMLTLSPGTYTININKSVGTTTSGTITITHYAVKTPAKGWTYQGGLRIKKIAQYETSGLTTPLKETNYNYQRFDNSNISSGEMYEGMWINDGYRDTFINPQVSYTNVKVYDTGNNGYTKYYYRSQSEAPETEYFPPGGGAPVGYTSNYLAFKKGLLAKREVYDKNGIILQSTDNTYAFEETGVVFPTNFTLSFTNEITRASWVKLASSTSKSYTYNASNVQKITEATENFTYNSTNQRIDEHTVSNSLGETLKTKNYYHTGNSTLSKNRIAELEKVERYRGTELLNTAKINYINSFSGNVSYLPQTITASKGSNALETRVRYVAYDEFGNPLQVQQENGLIVSYIWGYNKTVPIAKIENLAYATISSSTITDLQTKSNTANNEANLLTALNALRGTYPDAMITTFTYVPLVGISTVTDPKGDRTKYVYDNSGRLKEVRDKDNNLLSESSYFYKNSNATVQNYIQSKSYKVPTTTSIASPTISQANQSKAYYDGLGRTIQKTAFALSGSGKDIITHIEYDEFGRQVKDYLPFASSQNTMAYVDGTTLKLNTITQYQGLYSDNNPYSQKAFDGSPLNRVLEQAAPGNDWDINNSVKHTVRLNYQTNATNEVKLFKATSDFTSNTISLINSTGTVFYPETKLYKTITKDENWKTGDGSNNTTEEFKDLEGRVVMTRKYGKSVVGVPGTEVSVWHETYYVYDQYGNLTFVLPPMADGSVTSTVLNGVCYQYKYDFRNRLIEKKLPGKDWEFIVYDKLDRIVATGPALSPFTDFTAPNNLGWMMTKYDVFSRPVLTGWMQSATATTEGRATFQGTQNSATTINETKSGSDTTVNGVAFRYTNAAWPTSGYHLLTVNYYDNYDSNLTFSPALSYTAIFSQNLYNNTAGTKPTGLATTGWTRILEASTAYNANKHYTLYDLKSRPVRIVNTNYLGGYTQKDHSMEQMTGRVNYTETRHKREAADTEIYLKDTFTYTAQDRLLTHTHKIGASGTPQLMSKNSYSELGQLTTKQVGGTDTTTYIGLQKVDYTYNIRGWMTGINDINSLDSDSPGDLFAFKINYNTVQNETNYTGTPLYNGNISETYWRTASDDVKRKYGYFYDELNRLKNAVYQKPGENIKVTNSYDESLTYDKNGNIRKLWRNGNYDDQSFTFAMDNLSYFYHPDVPDRLMKVTDLTNSTSGFADDSNGTNDTVDDYGYDAYGNMITDQNKNILNTKYNHLNLPVEIVLSTSPNRKINYIYDGNGTKVRRVTTNGTVIATTDYLDGFQYLKPKTSAALALQFFPTAEGYVNNTVSGGVNNYNYIYTYKDHLGNVRLAYTKDPTKGITKILEESNYYPYGLQHANYNWSKQYYEEVTSGQIEIELVPALPYKYKYNGKEWQDELGLGVYDYGARNYEPAIGRWMNIDPLAEMSRRYTPYAYALDNPVYFIDPDGRRTFPHWEGDYNWKTGKYRSGSFDAAMANAGVSSDNVSTSSFDDVKISDGMEEDPFLMMYGANSTLSGNVNANASTAVSDIIRNAIYAAAGGPLNVLRFVIVGTFSSAHTPDWSEGNFIHFGTFSIENVKSQAKSTEATAKKGKDGSYTITFSDHRTYHGKGPINRMFVSALVRMKFYDKEIIRLDWTPAISSREAFKQEYRRMQTEATKIYPEGYRNPINQNIIQSPGKKFIEQDGF